MSTNKVILHGYLGKDPELKVTPNGTALCRFSLATTDTWKDKDGNKQSKTEWHNITAWGKLGEAIEKFFKKGSEMLMEGSIKYTEAKNPSDESKKIWYTNIQLTSFDFCGKKGETSHNDTPDPDEPGGYQGSSTSDNNGGNDDDQDIPF